MGFDVGFSELLIVLVVVALILGSRRRKPSDEDLFLPHLKKELGRMPVYSAWWLTR